MTPKERILKEAQEQYKQAQAIKQMPMKSIDDCFRELVCRIKSQTLFEAAQEAFDETPSN